MASIIKTTGADREATKPYRFVELGAAARESLAQAQNEADQIVAEARQQAATIRREAEQQGRAAAQAEAAQRLAEQLAPGLSALGEAAQQLSEARKAWSAHWEQAAVRLAAAMAVRVVRGELTRQPEIPLKLVREALEMAAGSNEIQIRLHPADHALLGPQVTALAEQLARVAEARIIADPKIERGGCRIDTRFGSIDQQLSAQLARIEAELT